MRHFPLLSCLIAVVFAATPAMAGPEILAGTVWIMSGAGKRAPVISFGADGKVSGSGGCNRFFGRYQQTGHVLTISPLGSTRMACAPDVMRKEQAFFDMLQGVRTVKVEGRKLLLNDGTGKQVAALARRGG